MIIMITERRSETRRRIAAETIFAMDRCSENIVRLTDLSTGGMQVRYSPENLSWPRLLLLDVFTSDRELPLVTNLSCRIVYDLASLMENDRFRGASVRSCGVRFEQVTDEQRASLNRLLGSIDAANPPGDDGFRS